MNASPHSNHCSTAGSAGVDALGTQHPLAEKTARIVSLVTSLTELVCGLGMADQMVGRTRYCIHPADALRSVPVIGGTKDLDLARLRALAPSHILVNIDENKREQVAEVATFIPHVIVTHPLKPDDNIALFNLIGGIFGRAAQAGKLAAEYAARLAELRAEMRAVPNESVLYLIWRKPWMTVSRDTYIAAHLAEVGWQTLPAQDPARYPEVAPGAGWLKTVQRVLLSSEPFPFTASHIAEAAALTGLPAASIHLVDGEMVSWYGIRAMAGLAYLAGLRRTVAGQC